ncbi:hypothetical protein Tco_0824310 [Tanacetum coccineum]|uniref:Uncharacterized protein n=1 Tax=Tanacetum coccineum TaxID=301880 RepID=A0ABQ5AKE7_9ASTR
MGNEPILALPEGADDFVVYYDAPSKDLEACLKKREKVIACVSRQLKVLIKDSMTNVCEIKEDVITYILRRLHIVLGKVQPPLERLYGPWLLKRRIRQSILSILERIRVGGVLGLTKSSDCVKKNEYASAVLLMPRVVKSRDEIFSRWGYCDNRGLSAVKVWYGVGVTHDETLTLENPSYDCYKVKHQMSTPTQCCDMGSDGYAYLVYDMFGIVDPNMQNEV